MKAFLLILTLFGVAGCTLLPRTGGDPPDQVLFLQGLEEVASDRSFPVFARLEKGYPDSPWTARAKAVQALQDALGAERRRSHELTTSLEECRVERRRLQGDVRSLEEYTAKLKALLAEAGVAQPPVPGR